MTGPAFNVLLYHGVHADSLPLGLRNSSGKHIPRSRFESEMRYLHDHRPVVSMREIAAAYRGEKMLPDDAVVVTFDDGFWNNYAEAWPVLEKFGIKATIYLATGFIGTGRAIWTDRLEAALTGTRKQEVRVDTVHGAQAFPLRTKDEILAALAGIKRLCKSLTAPQVEATVTSIEQQLESRADPQDDLYRFMTWNEVREMARSPLIDFGAHTIDHVSLARVAQPEMHRQIDGSVQHLKDELGACDLFSYPEGQEGDYNDAVIAHLRGRGFDHSPTAIAGTNRIGETGPFDIRRIMVGFENRPFPFTQSELTP